MKRHALAERSAAHGTSRHLLLLGMAVLTFAAALDPSDEILHIKVPAFIFVLALWLARRGATRPTVCVRIWTLVAVVSLVIPLCWTILGMLHQNVHTTVLDYGIFKAFLFLLILPVAISEDINLNSLIVRAGYPIAALTFAMVAVSFMFPAAFAALYAFTLEKGNAIIATSRQTLGLGVGMFYYKTSPLLVFPLAWYCGQLATPGRKRLFPLLCCAAFGTALILSGARANFLAAVFIVGFFVLRSMRRRFGLPVALVMGLLAAVLFSDTVVVRLANPEEASNSIKLGHIDSYVQEFNRNPSVLVWGEGAGSAFYSEGFEDWTTVTELSYLELIRVFGIPVTLFFLVGLFWISRRLFRQGQFGLGIAFISYLVICASNPLLISSTGFLAICAVWKEVERPSSAASAWHLLTKERREHRQGVSAQSAVSSGAAAI